MKRRQRLLQMIPWTLALIALAGVALVSGAQTAREAVKPGATATAGIFRCDCVVQGTPVEFPDDIYLRNTGTTTITQGTTLHWSIPGTNRQGDYKVAADLAAGKGVTVAGVLPGGVAAGTKCDVTKKESVQIQAAPRQPIAMSSFGCVVQGTPVEFPDDIYLSNNGTTTVTKGTIVHWSLPGTDRKGDYTLAADMLPGKGVTIAGALPGGVAAGTKCTAAKK